MSEWNEFQKGFFIGAGIMWLISTFLFIILR